MESINLLYFGLIQIEYKYKRLLAPRCCTGRPYFQPIHRVLPLPNRRSKWANHLIRLVETCLFQLVLELKCLFLFVSNKKCELYHCVTQFVKRVIRQNPTKLWRITKSVKIGRNKNFDELLTFLTNDRTTVISSNFDKLLFWRMANHPKTHNCSGSSVHEQSLFAFLPNTLCRQNRLVAFPDAALVSLELRKVPD